MWVSSVDEHLWEATAGSIYVCRRTLAFSSCKWQKPRWGPWRTKLKYFFHIDEFHIAHWCSILTHCTQNHGWLGWRRLWYLRNTICLHCINSGFLAIKPVRIWLYWYSTLNSNFMRNVHAPIPMDACDDSPILCREGEGGSEVPIDHTHWSCSEVPIYLLCTAWSHGLFTPRKPPED